MTYSIVYSSRTGNTALLAETLKESLPQTDRVYYGTPGEGAAEADLLFIGFWTDKGESDEAAAAFLESLEHKWVFLFGTAGFGGSQAYFDRILDRVKTHLSPSNTLVGSYMCQGKMPPAVRQRYEAMLPQEPEKMKALIENFDLALSHPDAGDLARLAETAKACLV